VTPIAENRCRQTGRRNTLPDNAFGHSDVHHDRGPATHAGVASWVGGVLGGGEYNRCDGRWCQQLG